MISNRSDSLFLKNKNFGADSVDQILNGLIWILNNLSISCQLLN